MASSTARLPTAELVSALGGLTLAAVNFHGSDGPNPAAGVVIGVGGVLYGTSEFGGAMGYGIVFSLTPPASPGGS